MTKRPGDPDSGVESEEKKPRIEHIDIVNQEDAEGEEEHGNLLAAEGEDGMVGTLVIQEGLPEGIKPEICDASLEEQHEQDGVEYGTLQISADGGNTVVMTTDGVHQWNGEAHEATENTDSNYEEYQITTEDGQHVITSDGHVVTMEGGIVTAIEGSVEEVSNIDMVEESVEEGIIQMEQVEDGVIQIPMSQDGIALESVDESQALDESDDPESRYQNIIIQHMDILEPLTTLRKLLESRLSTSLADHEFYLQDTLPLEPDKNLVSQCVQGSGMVQINVEVKSQPGLKPRLNIVDILKPAEEVDVSPVAPAPVTVPAAPANTKVVIPFPEESENVTRWIVDQNFRKEQERLKIPFDPLLWNETHVKHWIQWAVKEFSLVGVDIEDFKLNGHELCELKHNEFTKFIPQDKGDIFWTHLELLRKCKFVAVIQQPTPHAITTITVSTTNDLDPRMSKSFNRTPKVRGIVVPASERTTPGNRTGNNGQIQLWQFLLELLTDKDCREVIHWVGDEGEFKLNNPEMVAQMWGQRKNKPTMNYEKLSRALRYYYDGDMIAKVHGKRFVYKFVCDLQMLLGYTAGELNRLVTECAEKKLQKVRESLRPGILRKTDRT